MPAQVSRLLDDVEGLQAAGDHFSGKHGSMRKSSNKTCMSSVLRSVSSGQAYSMAWVVVIATPAFVTARLHVPFFVPHSPFSVRRWHKHAGNDERRTLNGE
jgi:hypothetical protein